MAKKEKRYIRIPLEKYKEAIEKATPLKRKYLFKEYEKQEKGIAKREAKVELGVEKPLQYSRLKRKFTRQDTRKGIKRREHAIKGIAQMTGIIASGQTYAGAGRPRGSYKYQIGGQWVPIHVYKQMKREEAARRLQYEQEKYGRLASRGYTPEMVQQLQQQQALQELEYPQQAQMQQQQAVQMPSRVQQIQERVRQMQQPQMQRPPIQIVPYKAPLPQYQKMKVPTNFKGLTPSTAAVDDELSFRKWSAETTISPNTQRILDNVRRIQNKGKTDNIEMQRRVRERNMVGRSMNLMRAHENMVDTSMDFTGVGEDNILKAPSIFKEQPENFILRKRGASILDTKSTGNSLWF